MDLNALELPLVKLGEGDDLAYAKRIEAGVYAEHLLESGATDPRLPAVVASGRAAAEQLWWVGIRMAMQQAKRLESTIALPADELFQDGCVAVAKAIRRYDFTRGVRFTTFVFEFISRAMADASHHRMGRAHASRQDSRAARRAREVLDHAASLGHRTGLQEAARSAGVSPEAATRGHALMVSLDDVLIADPAAEASFERMLSSGLAFLDLLTPRQRRVLQLRFLDDQPMTLAEVAAKLGATSSTILRWERDAVEAARRLLMAERTLAS